ncbi:hypothetical protein [Vibrio sp. CAU 1672]|uniref:hypothetical protein n=1 Tax=Vibrio sp. CAU 1672 TaxID=3032594 RepID=UPI0023DC49C4|nr:hypothetical protein [Vibrio sp. CAU 1672]MDF2152519.1 hypothetical protein [Vibrio sp. CAU 1672]
MTIKRKYPPFMPAASMIRHTLTVNPAGLTTLEKQLFTDALYQLHCKIFDGVTRESFCSYVVDSPADYTRIRVYQNEHKEWVGYCAVHRFKRRITGRERVIFRAEAGLLREYRKSSQTLWFAFNQAVKFRLWHPLSSIYYLGSFVHPSVLYMFSKYFNRCYPLPGQVIPPPVKAMMLELADSFGLERVEGQSELVRKVGWITRESAADKQYWQANINPVVQYYLQTNPGYGRGNGLLTLLPLSFANVFLSLAKFLRRKLKGYMR